MRYLQMEILRTLKFAEIPRHKDRGSCCLLMMQRKGVLSLDDKCEEEDVRGMTSTLKDHMLVEAAHWAPLTVKQIVSKTWG